MLANNVPRGRILSASSDKQTQEATVKEKNSSSDKQTKEATMIGNIGSSDKQANGARLEDDISRNHSEVTLGNYPGNRSENVTDGVKVRKII